MSIESFKEGGAKMEAKKKCGKLPYWKYWTLLKRWLVQATDKSTGLRNMMRTFMIHCPNPFPQAIWVQVFRAELYL